MSTATESNPIESITVSHVAPAGSPVAQPAKRRLPWARIAALAALAVIAGSSLAAYLHYEGGFESTDDSFLEGNVHPVSARVTGTVQRVLIDDNEHVTAGQPLIELDPADLDLVVAAGEADLAQARATVVQVTAQIARTQADIQAATARIAQNGAHLRLAQQDLDRMEILASDEVQANSKQELDNARAAYNAAKAADLSLIAERASAEAALAAVQAQQHAATAQVEKAQAALATDRLQAGYTVILAPSTGRIARKSVEVGQRLQPGQPVLAVVSDDVWVIANFKEKQLARLRVGQAVSVEVDAVEGRTFRGVVESFSPGTGSRFSLLPPDNATGNFTKVVQRVPVKITFPAGSLGADAGRLSPGLSTIVTVSLR